MQVEAVVKSAAARLQRRQHRREAPQQEQSLVQARDAVSERGGRAAAGAPMTAREIAEALIAGKAPQATRKQAIDLQAAILAALRKRNGATVVGEGATARWALRASPSD